MAHGIVREGAPAPTASGWRSRRPAILDPRSWPWWLAVLGIFLASRIVSTAILLFFAANQAANAWTGPHPGLIDFSMLWDAHWYYLVAVGGYPAELPLTEDGHVDESAWAFLPAYPWLVRGLSLITWIPYDVMAVLVAVAAALGTAMLAFQLFREAGLVRGQALGAVALFCFGPVSPILQLGYAESLMLLLLTAALLLLQRRRYWAIVPIVAVMSFTRPSGLAFALALGLHVIFRWRNAARRIESFPPREQLAAVVAGVTSLLAGLAWVFIAALATGRLDAYTETELAWRAAYIGYQELVPFGGWVAGAMWWAEWIGLPGWTGILVLVAILAVLVALFFSPWMQRLGPTLRIWIAAWFLYLLAVFFPQSSTWRLLLPAYPALGAFALGRRWVLWAALAVSIAGQWWWVDQQWAVAPYDWTPP